jgi:hypothetical protein
MRLPTDTVLAAIKSWQVVWTLGQPSTPKQRIEERTQLHQALLQFVGIHRQRVLAAGGSLQLPVSATWDEPSTSAEGAASAVEPSCQPGSCAADKGGAGSEAERDSLMRCPLPAGLIPQLQPSRQHGCWGH